MKSLLSEVLKRMYFSAPGLLGLSTYYFLAFIFGEQIVTGLAWVNSISSVFALLNLSILYADNITRENFINKNLKYVLFIIILAFSVIIVKSKSYPAFVTLAFNVVFIIIIFQAYRCSEVRVSLILNALASFAIPLTSISWLSTWSACIMFLLILAFYFSSERNFKTKNASEINYQSFFYILAGVALQAPLILFPLFDVIIVKFVPAQLFLEYTLVWKLINGLIVFAFARQQYLLAFEKSKTKISSNVIKLFLIYLLFSSVNMIASLDTLGLVARACILSVMINYVSLYVRGLTRSNPLVTSSLVSLLMYAVLSTIFYISTVNFSISEISLKLYLQYLASCVLIPVVCVQFFRPFLSKDII